MKRFHEAGEAVLAEPATPWIMMAGKSLADLLSSLGGTRANCNIPDTTIITKTKDAHPVAQCRLEMSMAGALCTKTWDSSLIPGKFLGLQRNSRDAEAVSAQYTSTTAENYSLGYRPACWVKPLIED